MKAILTAALGIMAISQYAQAQEFMPPLANPTTPNFAGVVIGAAPDYLGSDDYFVGGAPMLRYQFEGREQYVFLYGNALGSNILNHPWLRTGPSAVLRFGRDDVDDDVVDLMKDIDMSFDIGWSIGAEYVDPENLARRARIDLYANHDVTGAHDGYVLGANVTAWTPMPFFLLGAYGGISWGSDDYMETYFGIDLADSSASGLPLFEADAGARDFRLGVVAIEPIGERWIVGAGLLYSRLLGDAADSPIVANRGSANQFIFGAGGAFTW